MSSTGAQGRLGQPRDTVAAVKQRHKHDSNPKVGASTSTMNVHLKLPQQLEIPSPMPQARQASYRCFLLPFVLRQVVFPAIQAYHCRHSDVTFSRLTLTSSIVSGNRISSISLSRPRSQRDSLHQMAKPHSASVGICQLPSCMESSFPFRRRNEPSSASTGMIRAAWSSQEPPQIICSQSLSISSRNPMCLRGLDRRVIVSCKESVFTPKSLPIFPCPSFSRHGGTGFSTVC
ncbi:hypothetical protein QR685DRAFT_571741 [Neurospora intermedia]|uniref:Uncharacterized protein n=1 Tax=Neurospora intermedia TaxID=5142 RepID=A0ABR3DDA2_NEUIN